MTAAIRTRPFVKWAGGKSKIAAQVADMFAYRTCSRYFEPFIGGGAVFLEMASRPASAVRTVEGAPYWAALNDANAALIETYEVVRNDVRALCGLLGGVTHTRELYERARKDVQVFGSGAVGRAARFIYLNKTCFNGLWRVNKKGDFNVPIGSYARPVLFEEENLLTWSRCLKGVTLWAEDFEVVLGSAQSGDFVYSDPPYLPRSKTASFTSYTSGGFGPKDHERLVEALGRASARGALFVCSQRDSEFIRKLYNDFKLRVVDVQHSVASRGAGRSKVGELLISNFTPRLGSSVEGCT